MVADSWFDQHTDVWLFQRIVEQMPLAVAIWQADTDDPHGLRLVYVNPYNVTAVGADLSPFIGMRLAEAFPTLVQTPLPGHILAVALEREPEYQEIHRSVADGTTEVVLRMDVRPLGRRCAMVSYTNITEQSAAAADQ